MKVFILVFIFSFLLASCSSNNDSLLLEKTNLAESLSEKISGIEKQFDELTSEYKLVLENKDELFSENKEYKSIVSELEKKLNIVEENYENLINISESNIEKEKKSGENLASELEEIIEGLNNDIRWLSVRYERQLADRKNTIMGLQNQISSLSNPEEKSQDLPTPTPIPTITSTPEPKAESKHITPEDFYEKPFYDLGKWKDYGLVVFDSPSLITNEVLSNSNSYQTFDYSVPLVRIDTNNDGYIGDDDLYRIKVSLNGFVQPELSKDFKIILFPSCDDKSISIKYLGKDTFGKGSIKFDIKHIATYTAQEFYNNGQEAEICQ
tara:strand:+ start:169 stop:1140 length:972 start_codon:yes stop_codon:yes gene_type:complete